MVRHQLLAPRAESKWQVKPHCRVDPRRPVGFSIVMAHRVMDGQDPRDWEYRSVQLHRSTSISKSSLHHGSRRTLRPGYPSVGSSSNGGQVTGDRQVGVCHTKRRYQTNHRRNRRDIRHLHALQDKQFINTERHALTSLLVPYVDDLLDSLSLESCWV